MLRKAIIIIICIGIVVVRIIYPDLNFDWISFSLILIAALLIFSSDLKEYTERVKKLKVGDLEIELEERIKELAIKTDETLEEKSETIKKPPSISGPPWMKDSKEQLRDKISEMIDIPEAALVLIAIEIEKELRAIFEKADFGDMKIPMSPIRQINLLNEKGIIDVETKDIFQQFWQIRNKVVHGHSLQLSEKQRIEIIEIGLKVLKLLEIAKNDLNGDGNSGTRISVIE